MAEDVVELALEGLDKVLDKHFDKGWDKGTELKTRASEKMRSRGSRGSSHRKDDDRHRSSGNGSGGRSRKDRRDDEPSRQTSGGLVDSPDRYSREEPDKGRGSREGDPLSKRPSASRRSLDDDSHRPSRQQSGAEGNRARRHRAGSHEPASRRDSERDRPGHSHHKSGSSRRQPSPSLYDDYKGRSMKPRSDRPAYRDVEPPSSRPSRPG